MVLAIHNDIQSMNAQRNVLRMTRENGGVVGRVASGLEIKKTVDDYQGLSIGMGMTARIRGINQTMRNANEAISMVQVAQGAIDETVNALQTIRELAIKAANDATTTGGRWRLHDGVRQLLEEIDRIAGSSAVDGQREKGLGVAMGVQSEVDGNHDMIGAIKEAASASLMRMGQVIREGREDFTVDRIEQALDLATDLSTRLEDYQDQVCGLLANLEQVKGRRVMPILRKDEVNEAMWTVESVRDELIQNADVAIDTQANQGLKVILELLDG
ncbi:MAG: hypothetical protein HQL81_02030 [Magnetococcales bacterium]|nr:hypothetical protein [Magnetococcales bacterium]